jgi:hypothetical protein
LAAGVFGGVLVMAFSKKSYKTEEPEAMGSDITIFKSQFAERSSNDQQGNSHWDPITGLPALLWFLGLY